MDTLRLLSMVVYAPVLFMHIILWIKATIPITLALPLVNLDIPVNPVKPGGVLSIHCTVGGLNPYNSVRLSRHRNYTIETLSLDGKETTSHDKDRDFISVRQLVNDSWFYSVTILRVSRTDRGTYFCSVISQNRVIAEMAAFVEIGSIPEEPVVDEIEPVPRAIGFSNPDEIHDTSPGPTPTTILDNRHPNNLHNKTLPVADLNWALVIVNVICIILSIGIIMAIVFYCRSLYQRKGAVSHTTPETQRRSRDIRVEYRQNVVPNVYVAVQLRLLNKPKSYNLG